MLKSRLISSLGCLVLLVGCSKEPAAPAPVPTAPLQNSFQNAEPATKNSVEAAIKSIQEEKYPEAVSQLQTLAGKAKLTPEQQKAITDTMALIQARLTQAAEELKKQGTKAAEQLNQEGKKALGDLKNSLGK